LIFWELDEAAKVFATYSCGLILSSGPGGGGGEGAGKWNGYSRRAGAGPIPIVHIFCASAETTGAKKKTARDGKHRQEGGGDR